MREHIYSNGILSEGLTSIALMRGVFEVVLQTSRVRDLQSAICAQSHSVVDRAVGSYEQEGENVSRAQAESAPPPTHASLDRDRCEKIVTSRRGWPCGRAGTRQQACSHPSRIRLGVCMMRPRLIDGCAEIDARVQRFKSFANASVRLLGTREEAKVIGESLVHLTQL
ncbi:hypothetical protein IE81DRAFT_38450 [Ceraceosorus guamensis]|uniref:Uncharacterized protein n=1 Tax=Ceraceosorus guamensis TaxID=1522189 RepID=A0A316W851_9BASI|nr:hypothetical protein IE81DRAFT_38450 [Ceraceosorus guamensis]PWN44223.1 hypothetical protein IE81DRAFT_38450 [Ceraceosorus guamensis]